MARILFDESRAPLIVLRYPSSFTQDEWDEHMRVIESHFEAGPFALINDTRGGQVPNAAQRRSITEMYRLHEAKVRENWIATGVVTSSQIVLRILMALNWVMPIPHPFRAFNNFELAERWVLSLMSERGIEIPHRRVG